MNTEDSAFSGRHRGGAFLGPGQLRALVFDPELGPQEFVRFLLERGGFDVEAASTCVDALSYVVSAGAAEYALIVIDVSLPRHGGPEVLRTVLELLPATPVLVVTASLPGEVSCEGVACVLPKPVLAEQLTAAVSRILQGADVAEAAQRRMAAFV